MADAFYHRGLSIEFDPSIPRLTIDGRKVPEEKVNEILIPSKQTNDKTEKLQHLAKSYIDNSPEFKKRETDRENHLTELQKGVENWNECLQDLPVQGLSIRISVRLLA